MIYEVSLDAALVVLKMKAKGKRRKIELNNSNQSRGPLKYAFFSIIF